MQPYEMKQSATMRACFIILKMKCQAPPRADFEELRVPCAMFYEVLLFPNRRKDTFRAHHAALTTHVLITPEETASALIVSVKLARPQKTLVRSCGRFIPALALLVCRPGLAFTYQQNLHTGLLHSHCICLN